MRYTGRMAGRLAFTIVAVGKLREKYWQSAEAEYSKRLGGYTSKFSIVEVADEPTPDDASPAQEVVIKRREAEKILAQISPRDYVIALDRNGVELGSVAFAERLERLAADASASAYVFVIGGSLGLDTSVTERANLTLSFSAFTFPHQLMRIILLEQLYRICKINGGENYHK